MKEAARIMSLQDGTAKMSKSAESELSRIDMLDPPDVIAQKVKKCKTDSVRGMTYGDPERPEATNLLNIYMAMSGMSLEEAMQEVEGMGWGDFKPRLTGVFARETARPCAPRTDSSRLNDAGLAPRRRRADALVSHLEPIQKRYAELAADPAYLQSVLDDGAQAASEVADQTLSWAQDAMGFAPRGAVPVLKVPQSKAAKKQKAAKAQA